MALRNARCDDKDVEKLKLPLKSDKNNRYFTCGPLHIYNSTSLSSSRNEKSFRQSCRENQNTHFVFNSFPPHQNYFTVCEIMGTKNALPGGSHMTIWRMRVACCIPKATNTRSELVVLTPFPLKLW